MLLESPYQEEPSVIRESKTTTKKWVKQLNSQVSTIRRILKIIKHVIKRNYPPKRGKYFFTVFLVYQYGVEKKILDTTWEYDEDQIISMTQLQFRIAWFVFL